MKKFFEEFKKFIMRGNVMDLAVGVIIGSAFTAIVTALSNNILRPVINWLIALICGEDSLSNIYTFLKRVVDENGVVDLAQSIYIDWGAFINAIINFIIIAFVLFTIVKIINHINEGVTELVKNGEMLSKKEVKALRKQGKTIKEIKQMQAEQEAAAKKAEEERKAEEAKNAPPTTEQLLTEILAEIKNKKGE
ncbi:MAG: large conductance mechanosensitive channel protein MscL [Candidatus Borkfalkiaceae bacterium]|nr:large conductance mechanosensitive channel protein MscL [Christensenellaceae bacterium]MDY3725215.1 large conductance mechanosensitive channel protein MscL [Christensenellaceae bacterium]